MRMVSGEFKLLSALSEQVNVVRMIIAQSYMIGTFILASR